MSDRFDYGIDVMKARNLTRSTYPMLVACALWMGVPTVQAQSIEPRAYSNAPVGMSFFIAGYAETRGGVAFDTALPEVDTLLTRYLQENIARAAKAAGFQVPS